MKLSAIVAVVALVALGVVAALGAAPAAPDAAGRAACMHEQLPPMHNVTPGHPADVRLPCGLGAHAEVHAYVANDPSGLYRGPSGTLPAPAPPVAVPTGVVEPSTGPLAGLVSPAIPATTDAAGGANQCHWNGAVTYFDEPLFILDVVENFDIAPFSNLVNFINPPIVNFQVTAAGDTFYWHKNWQTGLTLPSASYSPGIISQLWVHAAGQASQQGMPGTVGINLEGHVNSPGISSDLCAGDPTYPVQDGSSGGGGGGPSSGVGAGCEGHEFWCFGGFHL